MHAALAFTPLLNNDAFECFLCRQTLLNNYHAFSAPSLSHNQARGQYYHTAIMGKYSDDSTWDDIVPLPQDDGGPNPLAAIAYTDEYSEAMSYLRAIMAKNEMSERALALTEDIIDMNAAHYTVWFVNFPQPSYLLPLFLPR